MIKRNSGFTLVEVMITAAVMGGLALVGMQMMKSQTKQTTKASFDSETLLITNEIVGLLTDPAKCLTTFGPAGTKSALYTAPGNINAINGTRYYTVTSGSAPSAGYGNGGVQIQSYEISSTPAEILQNYAYLTVKYVNKQILKSTAGTPLVLPRMIKMYVEVDGSNNITKCRSLSAAYSEIWQRNLGNLNLIYYAGYVGIGTTTPEGSLHVTSANSGAATVQGVSVGTSGNYASLELKGATAGTGGGFIDFGFPSDDFQGRILYNNSDNSMALFTSAAERMRILSTGNVGINTATPAQRLEVAGGIKAAYGEPTASNTSAAGFSFDGDTGVFAAGDGLINIWSNNVKTVQVYGGNVGIGIATNPSYVMNILGNTYTQGTVYGTEFAATSDRNAKANIKKLNNEEAFKKISKLSPVSFTWKHNQSKDMGFIAQEVESIFPEFVLHNVDGTYSLKYNSFAGPIVASIQHLKDENEQLKKQLKEQEGQIKALQEQNKAILIELKKINSRPERKSGQIIRP